LPFLLYVEDVIDVGNVGVKNVEPWMWLPFNNNKKKLFFLIQG
jgi:hypothetical protein